MTPLEERILVLHPATEEAERCRALLARAGIGSLACPDPASLIRALEDGAAAVLLAEEGLSPSVLALLVEALDRQPLWSELPILLLAHGAGGGPAASAEERLGHVTRIESPLRSTPLVTAAQAALRSRQRQYQVREQLREREAAETALRESEERLRFSLAAGQMGFWRHDVRTDELICSDLCKAHFGRAPQEPFSHEEVLDTVHPEDRERAREAIRSAISAGEGYHLEYRVVWPDGSVHWLMVRGRATCDAAGKPVSTHGLTLDITQRKRDEALQAEQGERLRLLSESAGHLLATDDPEKMVEALFERVRRYLNLDCYFNYSVETPGEMLRLASYAGISQEQAERIRLLPFGEAACGAVAASRTPLTLSEVQSCPDPRAALARELGVRAYTCNPLTIGDRLLGTLSFATQDRDRFSEDELDFLRTISHYVALAQERVRIEENLRNEARRKDEFVAMLAHELRNPLAPVAHALEILRTSPGEEPASRARGVMERQVRHMTRLIEDLLDVSRISTGKITLKRERLDLVAAVGQAVESVRSFVATFGHHLEINLPPTPLYVEFDPVRLEQVVTNLLNNAAKYTEPGGHIHLALEADGGSARIRVRDTGIGIPSDLLGEVFGLFIQGERRPEESQGGLGVGLALVHNLVRLHGGEVEALSDGPGRGSEFRITLPLTDGPAAERPGPAQPVPILNGRSAVQGGNAKRLLVADDNRDSAETLSELAEIWGFEVQTAYDGPSALHQASAWEPAVLLLDIGMPGISGLEVARRLRQDGRFRNAMLVALTGYGQDEDLERSRAAGFDHHLVKPVDTEKLQKLLTDTPAAG